MPNLPAHISLAMQTAEVLRHPNLETHLGYFLMGSTSPDIRVITRKRRELYHFTDLDFQQVGAGVQGMFGSHPELGELDGLDGPTKAFVAGYMTHLLVDETYILNLFRPYFGNAEVFEDAAAGRMLDRALQLDLDRGVWDRVGGLLEGIDFTPEQVQVGFLEPEALARWRDWVFEVVARGFTWDRLRFMARRIVVEGDERPADELVDSFLDRIPQSVDEIYDAVPRERVEDFKADAVRSMVTAVGDYLG